MTEPNDERHRHARALWAAACGGMPEGINEARIRAMSEAVAARDAALIAGAQADRAHLEEAARILRAMFSLGKPPCNKIAYDRGGRGVSFPGLVEWLEAAALKQARKATGAGSGEAGT